MNKTDIFLCYRRHGAQTAKLFKKYLMAGQFPGSIWYSDIETKGNYKNDIPQMIGGAECAVLFIDKDFTKDFLTPFKKQECITALEVVQIARRKLSAPDFELYTIFLDRQTGFTPKENADLEKLFKKEGIEHAEQAVKLFTQNNAVFFFTARDDEEALVQRISKNFLTNRYYAENKPNGNFFFGGVPTFVDVLVWDTEDGIDLSNISFTADPKQIEFYQKAQNAKVLIQEEIQNNTMVSLIGIDTILTDDEEKKKVDIRYQTIEYKLFHKTLKARNVLGIDRILARYDWRTDIYTVPNAMGMAFAVLTADNKMILTRRSKARSIRPEEYDCSIVEGLQIQQKDREKKPYFIGDDVYLINEIHRGYREEICDDDSSLTIKINGIVLDKQYGQWNVVGTIRTEATSEQILSAHALRKDTYEVNDLFYVDLADSNGCASPDVLNESLAPYLRGKMWDMAKSAIYAALIEFGYTQAQLYEFSKSI